MSAGPPIVAGHRRREGALQRSRARGYAELGVLVVILTLLCASPVLSWASLDHAAAPHPPLHSTPAPLGRTPIVPSSQSIPVPGQLSPLLAPSLVLAVLALLGITWRRRRAPTISLGLLLGLFAFQTGFHSVHHLSDPQKGAQCPVFSASQHITGAPAWVADLCIPTLAAEPAPSVGDQQLVPSRLFRPDLGRAPPFSLT